MVAPKVKSSIGVAEDIPPTHPNGGVGDFKIYPDNDNKKIGTTTKMKSVVKAGASTASDSKGSSLIMEKKNNRKNNASAKLIVGRKALADVSNVPSISHKSVISDGSKPVRNPSTSSSFVPIRKSLPILKKMSQTTTNSSKGSDERTNKSNQIHGLPVKSSVTSKVASQMNIGRSHLRGNWAGDGFTMIRSSYRDQTRMDPSILPRKSFRPSSNTAPKDSKANGKLRFTYPSTMRKPIATAKVISKKKAETSSARENVGTVVSCEATRGEASTDGDEFTRNQKLDVSAKRKSGRRRSYTSLLMAQSKLLGEQGEVRGQEKLQGIDDDCNQLEVAEYVHEIYQYYWVLEVQNTSLENYMSIQADITPQMRGILINWLIEVHLKFELMQETLYLMVTLLDRYLSQVQIEKNELQLVGLTSLLLASKYEDFWHPRIKDLVGISAQSYTTGQMLAMEKLILKKLKFRLNEPTPYVFMLRFLKAAQSDTKLEHMAFYLIELCLVEYEALKYKPSLLCASAIYVARTTLQINPAWTPLLARHTRYEVSNLRDCAELILRFQKAAKSAQLKVTYEKYSSAELGRVAETKPLMKLPF